MNQKEIDKKVIWKSIFMAGPTVIAMNYGKLITDDAGMQILYGSLFGGVAGLISFVAYYFTESLKITPRIIVLVGLLFLTILPAILYKSETKHSKEMYSTCIVCGYKGFKTNEKSCDNCGTMLSDEELKRSGLADMNEFIRIEQIYHFIPDNEGSNVEFYEPVQSADGFEKDLSWKPVVTADTIKKYADSYYEYEKRYPIKTLDAGDKH